jgi:hypothetical protein
MFQSVPSSWMILIRLDCLVGWRSHTLYCQSWGGNLRGKCGVIIAWNGVLLRACNGVCLVLCSQSVAGQMCLHCMMNLPWSPCFPVESVIIPSLARYHKVIRILLNKSLWVEAGKTDWRISWTPSCSWGSWSALMGGSMENQTTRGSWQ